MINLRKAQISEAAKVLQFYRNVIKSIEGSEFKPKWSGNYPDLGYIKNCIENGEMYIHVENDNIIACVVLNSNSLRNMTPSAGASMHNRMKLP